MMKKGILFWNIGLSPAKNPDRNRSTGFNAGL
jgi:hypothetical protein